MTGLRHCTRGSSLRNESAIAGARRLRSNIESFRREWATLAAASSAPGSREAGAREGGAFSGAEFSITLAISSSPEHEVLHDRAERERRHESECPDEKYRADQEYYKRRTISRHGA